jgi:mono/diheme cytochrome c family protein
LVARLTSLTIALYLLCLPAWGAQSRPMCLECHPAHFSAQGSCIGCHRGDPNTRRKNIAHHRLIAGRFALFTKGDSVTVREGKRLLEQFACRRCHVSGGKGNRLATSLDNLPDARTPEEIMSAIRSPALGMPDFRLTEAQAVALVNVIHAGEKQGRGKGQARPLVLHFEAGKQGEKDIFTRKCGSCHRALTENLGVIGSGAIGPNLSGLLSAWYPKTFGEGEAWNTVRLRRWLKNPRAVRPLTDMPPVELSLAEFRQLTAILELSGSEK